MCAWLKNSQAGPWKFTRRRRLLSKSARHGAVHEPVRRCAACMRTAPKSHLLRFVRLPQTQQVVFDPHQNLPGRGAYLCPQKACLLRALKRNALSRALRTPVPSALLEALLETAP
ncbi:MAG: YlxR family protein [Fimbriimonadales bacterium]|nr:YlxR family protein [Fimbriimonadales bacterium]